MTCALTHSLENTSITYIKSDIFTKRLVWLPLDLDENSLLFTKWLLMIKKIIRYS